MLKSEDNFSSEYFSIAPGHFNSHVGNLYISAGEIIVNIVAENVLTVFAHISTDIIDADLISLKQHSTAQRIYIDNNLTSVVT